MGNPNWIQGAVKKPGAMTAMAKDDGESNGEFEQENKHASGKAGQRARFALAMKGLHHAASKD